MPCFLLTDCPLQGKTVDIPPFIYVSTIGLQITSCSRKCAGLLAHGVQYGASVTNWHKCQSAQYCCGGYDIQYLRLLVQLINNCWFECGQPICSCPLYSSKQKCMSASRSKYLGWTWFQTGVAACRTKHYPLGAGRPHGKYQMAKWRQSLDYSMPSIFHSKGKLEIHCSPVCFVCPTMASVLKTSIWPVPPEVCSLCKVSRRILFCK
jgi:hypothetical protein